jgi:hypothetical protein
MSFPKASVSLDFGVPELLRSQKLAREDDLLVLVRDLDADRSIVRDPVDPDRLGLSSPRQRSSTSPTIFE